jgi:hypothetical protein
VVLREISTESQAPNNKQAPVSKISNKIVSVIWGLVFENYLGFVIWNLNPFPAIQEFYLGLVSRR